MRHPTCTTHVCAPFFGVCTQAIAHADLAAVVQRELSRADGRAWQRSYTEHRARRVRAGELESAVASGTEDHAATSCTAVGGEQQSYVHVHGPSASSLSLTSAEIDEIDELESSGEIEPLGEEIETSAREIETSLEIETSAREIETSGQVRISTAVGGEPGARLHSLLAICLTPSLSLT